MYLRHIFTLLLEGKAAVYKSYGHDEQVKLSVLEPGQYFGEMAVIESYPRSSTVVAEEDSKVIEIAASELNEYITENPNKILDIIVVLGNRLKTMTDDYNEIKKALDNVRKENSKNNYASFFASMSKQSIYLSAKNFRLERPSAEALREAADAVSKKGTSGETYPYGTIIFKQGEPGASSQGKLVQLQQLLKATIHRLRSSILTDSRTSSSPALRRST